MSSEKRNLFTKISISITAVIGVLVLSLPVIAQQNKLLDSAQSIFRAQPELALSLLVQVKNNALKTKDNNSIVAAGLIEGNIAYFKGKHDKALEIYLHALVIAEKNNLHEQIAAVCNEIGTLFKKNKDLEKALFYYTRAMNEAIVINNNAQIANSHNNIGLVYEEEGNYSNALKQYQKSLFYYQKAKEKLGESYTLEYIGYVFGLMKKYESANEYLQKSLSLRRELKDNYGIAVCLIELTEINRDKKDFKQAISYAKQAISFCKEINYPDMLQQGYLLLSEIYEQKKDFDQAYQAHKKYVSVKDSIFNVTKSNQINELQTQYDTEKKEQKIDLLNKESAIQKLKLTQRDGIIFAICLAFLFCIIIGYLVSNRYKLKQNARLQNAVIVQQDLAAKAVLNAEENERKRIANELHDGLGQMFSAVKLNLSALADHFEFKDEHGKKMYGKTLSLVDESCKEVRVISHQMTPNVLLKSGLTSAIRDFIDKIDVKKLKVNLSTFGLQDRLDENIEIVLYRVIQETVNNVIKHAGANSLDIQLTKDEEGINVMIEDNGNGFDANHMEKFEGMGLKNILTRVTYLNGTVDFSSTPDQGTLIAIFIPCKKQA
ncbi:tetratricopeptide repeat-containing sensor histidine kinase [Pedobacter boryungensis]|uniref:histidine kinase n=1 Tax=Pedobacter boryungensis TaxID=869962 RepID=A0ABX2DCK0_9SPHI|nr:sensor histidine kinase [Pedobacter boryungensis]NQX31752.1 sensor histidine kinase [Pedobacter boryungensis]